VDDLHARAGLPGEKTVQIHGDIFITRCSRCKFEHEHDHEHEHEHESVPTHLCGPLSYGSVNNCRGANYTESKVISMAERVTL
jgi:NAD-dependent SIR2 family protein deacetylase